MPDTINAHRPIIQLDTQLANQIAAGEVVERPASVVKELLENSLDAGADQIDVEVINGGKQLIRIRDNGHGIHKDQIPLALAPHATSKISSLADLEALHSFGFRGEALASISSVSKFSLTSRTPGSEEGWRAIAEGQSMAVKLTPAPATTGTRIDVSELFYNTPARRRFLRTDKTEFAQIEAVIKQIALANPQLTLSLKHNQRIVRRFKAAFDMPQVEQRLAQICGKEFIDQAVRVDVDYNQYRLSGWLGLPTYHRSQSDGQYFYVNHRPVKDKVLSHALREAYGPLLPEGRFPAFVLFFELPSQEVDVNVHPTKHEVRFHEVRQVHDFIVQAIEQCMQQGLKLLAEDTAVRQHEHQPGHELHSALGQTDTTSQYDSYNQFIASAYRSNLAEDRPRSDYSSTSAALLTQHANDWCLVQHNDQIGLLELDKLFNRLGTTESKAVQLRYPEIIQIPNSEQATFEQFCERRGVQLNISHDMIKIIAVPGNWQHTDIKALVWSWYCFEQDQELPSMQWLVPWIENPPTGFKLPINFLAMAKLKRVFDGSA